ncbi:phosphoribosylformylglycinamidine synthase [Candidatus Woesearchaeota archaeon]|nr:phosphoribosylformylglycinamidine synthase [Candidatus Woesearchaeota archaeon]
MAVQIEVVTKDRYGNFEGKSVAQRLLNAGHYVQDITVAQVYTIDDEVLTPAEIQRIQNLVTNSVTQTSSLESQLTAKDNAWLIEIGILPRVTDPDGDRIKAVIEQLLGRKIGGDVYYSQRLLVKDNAPGLAEKVQNISKLFFNEVTHAALVYGPDQLKRGIPQYIPRSAAEENQLEEIIDLNLSHEELVKLSFRNEWALNLDEMFAIKTYFERDDVRAQRRRIGLGAMPTRTEMEVIAQTWSEHCKHKIFNAEITYEDEHGNIRAIDSLFKTFIRNPTEEIIRRYNRTDIVSKFSDNAGIIRLNDKWLLAIKCETHNSPTNDAPFGGSATGLVGVFRDILGAGKGGWVIGGQYFFVTGMPNYNGALYLPQRPEPIVGFYPKMHPAELLHGMIEGVQDGGNKSGIPTTNGGTFHHNSFLGKCLMFASAIGVIPAEINGKPGWKKKAEVRDYILTIGGRVGIDGIHGATVSSLESEAKKHGGHVQIAYPYNQRKVMEALMELRQYINGLTDCGAGGTSSAVGEMAQQTGGADVVLDHALLKYLGLAPYQIKISESQERMTISVPPENLDAVKSILRKHDVEFYDTGRFTDSGKLKTTYRGQVSTYLDMDFLHNGNPRMRLKAKWAPPQFAEPALDDQPDYNGLVLQLLASYNLCSKEFITRRFDHEVQDLSIVKPLIGRKRDIRTGAVVQKFDIENNKEGVAEADVLNPLLGQIDTYHMVANGIDEVVRKLVAIGGNPDKIVLNDNFCWPSPINDEYKAAQLVRAGMALEDYATAFNAPCISGKDSMSVDGKLVNANGEQIRVSGLPVVKLLGAAKVEELKKVTTLEAKVADDLVYVIGTTKDELGGSDFYNMLGYVGNDVPKVNQAEKAKGSYKALYRAISEEIVASAHAVAGGGLVFALTEVALGGDLGLNIDLSKVNYEGKNQNYRVLFSQSASRFVVTIDPKHKERFEMLMQDSSYAQIGTVTSDKRLEIKGISGNNVVNLPIEIMRAAYTDTFGRQN